MREPPQHPFVTKLPVTSNHTKQNKLSLANLWSAQALNTQMQKVTKLLGSNFRLQINKWEKQKKNTTTHSIIRFISNSKYKLPNNTRILIQVSRWKYCIYEYENEYMAWRHNTALPPGKKNWKRAICVESACWRSEEVAESAVRVLVVECRWKSKMSK